MTSPDHGHGHGQIKPETTAEERAEHQFWFDPQETSYDARLHRDIDTLLAHSLAVERAVEAEREACVLIADELVRAIEEQMRGMVQSGEQCGIRLAATTIRDRIRSRPSVPATDTEPGFLHDLNVRGMGVTRLTEDGVSTHIPLSEFYQDKPTEPEAK
jgi:hypothetical protein